MSGWDEYEKILTIAGVSLGSLGVSDIGLLRNDALKAVEVLRSAGIPIAGGDVYIRRPESLELAYANWYTQRTVNEAWNDYLERSCGSAKSYIAKYQEISGADILFALVPDSRPNSIVN